LSDEDMPDGWVAAAQFELRDSKAADLADLTSIQADLSFVLAACRWLAENSEPDAGELDPVEATLIRGMWESAVISYGRCFPPGGGRLQRNRTPIPADIIDQLSDDEKAVHAAMLEERNQHIAHRLDLVRQQARIGVALTEPPQQPAVMCVFAWVNHHVFEHKTPPRLAALVERLARDLSARIDELRDSIRVEWNTRLPEAYERAERKGLTIEHALDDKSSRPSVERSTGQRRV
jgi:hypothetical protein